MNDKSVEYSGIQYFYYINNILRIITKNNMPCKIRSNDTVNDDYICGAEAVLKKLYTDFTDTPAAGIAISSAGNTVTNVAKPKDILRISSGGSGAIQDIFKEIDKTTSSIEIKNQMKNILLQESNTTASIVAEPTPQTTFTNTSANFKGIYGLSNTVNLLKSKINTEIIKKTQSGTGNALNIDDGTAERLEYINTFYEKKNTKDTLEEISSRENEIYREKFLNIILILLGIFIVGTQLRQRYFSNVSVFGGLFSGFGSGLGSSNIGSLFSSSAYTLKSR